MWVISDHIDFYKFITGTLGIDYVKVAVDHRYYKRFLKTRGKIIKPITFQS